MDERRVAVVTGSGKRRVGYHVAESLAERGYALVVHYLSSAAEADETAEHFRKTYGVPVLTFQTHIADEDGVRRMAAAIHDQFGRVDVLVNSAAIWNRKKLEEVTAADLRDHFEVNTLGTFLACQHFGLAMVQQPTGGCIVNIGDWADLRPYVDYSAYFPSKAAIPGMTRLFAVELGSRNPRVRVNAVLPGPVMLPSSLSIDDRQSAIDATLVKVEGSPRHVAQAVLSFVDNEFVTGACLPVDGGRSVFARGL